MSLAPLPPSPILPAPSMFAPAAVMAAWWYAGAELAAGLGLWIVALRCRVEAYCEVLRRLADRPIARRSAV